jgi:hypothetical protein
MKYGRNLTQNYMDRYFDTDRLFSHYKPQILMVVLPKKDEVKPKAIKIDIFSSFLKYQP